MDAFATVSDYEGRYGAADDQARLALLLEDATGLLLSAYERHYGAEYAAGEHAAFDRNACAVCCAVVSRSLNVPSGMEGVSQLSQTAGSYSASATFSNPTGDMFVTKGDYRRLGLYGNRLRAIDAMTYADRGEDGAD